MIANDKLTFDQTPPPDASWDEIEKFALSYDGYKDGTVDVENLHRIATNLKHTPLQCASLDEIRSALFFVQRLVKWNGYSEVDPTEIEFARSLISQIKKRFKPDD